MIAQNGQNTPKSYFRGQRCELNIKHVLLYVDWTKKPVIQMLTPFDCIVTHLFSILGSTCLMNIWSWILCVR